MKDRQQMLQNFVSNKELQEISNLDLESLEAINFSNKTNSALLEALKRMIFSYCQEDAESTVVKNINITIENMVKESLE
jgi:hypothetical protein